MCAEVRVPDLDCTVQWQDKRTIVSAANVFSAVHLALFLLSSVMRNLGRSLLSADQGSLTLPQEMCHFFSSGVPLSSLGGRLLAVVKTPAGTTHESGLAHSTLYSTSCLQSALIRRLSSPLLNSLPSYQVQWLSVQKSNMQYLLNPPYFRSESGCKSLHHLMQSV